LKHVQSSPDDAPDFVARIVRGLQGDQVALTGYIERGEISFRTAVRPQVGELTITIRSKNGRCTG
jgi:hypothetical protein